MAQGEIYKGKSVRLSVNGDTIYHATEASISVSTTLESIATKDTNGNVQIPSNYEWSASLSTLVADLPAASEQASSVSITQLQLAGTEIDFEFTTNVTGDFVFSGKAYVSQSDISAAVGSAVSGSFSFTGNGDLTVGTVAP